MKTHYETLGVTKSSTADEIKKAYKKLASKHHPDKGGDEGLFKEVSEAYDTLKDPTKKAQYDNPYSDTRSYAGNRAHTMRSEDDLRSFFESMGRGGNYRPQQNADVTIQAEISIADCIAGKKLTVSYRLKRGQIETVDIDIPAGARTGHVIKYQGLGDDYDKDMQRGNLNVRVILQGLANWHVVQDDLVTVTEMDALDMITGGEIEIAAPDGKKLKIKVPSGTKNGTVFGLGGHGLPQPQTKIRGNIHVKIDALIPQTTNTDLIKRINKLKKLLRSK